MLPNESLWKRDTPENDIKKYDESLDDSYKAPPSSDGIHFAGTDVPMPVFMRPPAPWLAVAILSKVAETVLSCKAPSSGLAGSV